MHDRRRTGIATLLVALAAALWMIAGSALAQEARKLDLAEVLTVASVDADARRVHGQDESGADLVFAFDDTTRVIRGGETIEASALDAGDRVVVEARTGLDGEPKTADRIVVVVDPPEAD